MKRKGTWLSSQVFEISDEELLANERVQKILAEIVTHEEAYEKAKQILSEDPKTSHDKKSAYSRLYLTRETIWELVDTPEILEEQMALKRENYFLYKRLTKWLCSISNQFSKALREEGKEACDEYTYSKKNFKRHELEAENPDITKHKNSLKPKKIDKIKKVK